MPINSPKTIKRAEKEEPIVPDHIAVDNMPSLPLKIRLAITAWRVANSISLRSDGTINRWRLDILDPKSAASKKPIGGVASSDVTFDTSNNLWLRLYTPATAVTEKSTSLPVIFYFHGGGFVLHAANSMPYDYLCRQFAAQVPAVVISVNYRRSPEDRFPIPYEDCFDALKYIDDLQNSSTLPENADLSRCFIGGDSAGGNIAHRVAIRASGYNFKRLKIAGVLAIQPFFSGEERTESELNHSRGPMLTLDFSDLFWKLFLPEGADRDHEAANVTGPNAIDLTEVKLPAVLVVIGGYDLLQDAQRKYCDLLRSSGKVVEQMEIPSAFHGFYGFTWLTEVPEFAVFMKGVIGFIHNRS